MKKRLVAAVAVVVSLAIAGSANAASKTIWHETDYDTVVSNVAGYPLTIETSDNDSEWLSISLAISGSDGVIGFTDPNATPRSTLYNPWDAKRYWTYRRVWLAPEIWRSLQDIRSNGFRDSMDFSGAAMALMTLDHEAQHWRLWSSDEGRVNACALADMPRLLTSVLGVPATVQRTVTVPQNRQVQQRYKVKVHGHWRWRSRYVWKTFYVDQQQTQNNPIYWNLITDAQAFYRSQPYPYNAGTCS